MIQVKGFLPTVYKVQPYHIVSPGDEIGPPFDVGDSPLSLMQDGRLPAVQPVSLIQQQLQHIERMITNVY